jgi:hypothetical protein
VATVTDEGSTPVYQFSVAPSGGAYQVVQDFSPSPNVTWDPMQQGSYNVQVVAESRYGASVVESATASYTVLSRVAGTSAVISPTTNPLVALYSAPPRTGSSMYVQFSQLGPNPSWQETSPLPIVPGDSTNFLVAGLLPNTTYLMRDVVDGGRISAPLAYTTGGLPSSLTFPSITDPLTTTSASDESENMVFHMGIGAPLGEADTFATDLAGNVVWYYDSAANNFPNYAVSVVPGGTVLMLGGNVPSRLGGYDTLREIDLAGDTVRQTNIYALNAELAALGDASIYNFSHDAQRLPNGDTAVIAGTTRVITVNGTATTYNADMVIVLDKNLQVVWAWNSLDWLDPNRLPPLGEGPGDFTHANSIGYSPTDGNLVVSMRAQDWVVKIAYANGTGDGHIVWHLGAAGDFTVVAPSSVASPWFDHQHNATYVNDNTIVVFDDGNGRYAITTMAQSRGQEWVLNEQTMTATLVVNAQLGNYSLALGSAQLLPNGNLAFTSGWIIPSDVGETIEVRPDGTQTFVQELNGLEYRGYLMSSLYGSPANVLNPGFEDPILGAGSTAWLLDPPGSSWSFSGTAGISGNASALTSGNPNAPQGSQVAFLQNTGAVSQVVQFALAGTYQINFSAAQGASNGASAEAVRVLVDGTSVGMFTPGSTSYTAYATSAFTVAAGAHTIALVGVGPSGSQPTAFVDAVTVDNAAPMGFSDPGFEEPSLGTGASASAYIPSGSPWTFSGTAGVAANGSTLTSGNPNAPQGSQVAFVEQSGTVGQSVKFPQAGTYVIGFSAAQRSSSVANLEEVEVEVDGKAVGTFTPVDATYADEVTAPVQVTAGSHTITFAGLDPSGADSTLLLDQASITIAPPASFADAGFESPNVGTGWQLDPTGTPWTFAGTAGISGNNSGMTSHNPNAPEGGQVGFLQASGSVSQVVNFARAGSYVIGFSAAQEGNYAGSSETVQVLVDGTAVSTFTPASTNYASYATDPFSVAAGSHTITLAGSSPHGVTYTAFLDQLSITSETPTGFSDPSFETPSQGSGQSSYTYDPSGSAWTFAGSAGLSGNGSGFTSGNPNAPQGSQVVFIQSTGAVSQVVNLSTAGPYIVVFSAAQRGNYNASNQQVDVEVDGTTVGSIIPTGTTYATYMTGPFSLPAGTHTFAFVGIDPGGADQTVFLDQVDLLPLNFIDAIPHIQGGVLLVPGTAAAGTITLNPTSISATIGFGMDVSYTVDGATTTYGPFMATTVAVSGGPAADALIVDGTSGSDAFTAGNGVVTVLAARKTLFTVTSSGVASTTLDGRGGGDSLTGPNQTNNWVINGFNVGTLDNAITFRNVASLTGGSIGDTFTFEKGGAIYGNLVANGTANALDYSQYGTPDRVDLQTATATGIGGTWTNIQSFLSTGSADTFVAADTANTWSITGANAGTVDAVSYSGFANLTGGAGNDRFTFQPGGSIAGKLFGGLGTNTLDDSQYGSAITVDLAAKSATGIGGAVTAIDAFIGTGGTTDVLIGSNVNSVWSITGTNAGIVSPYTFTAFPNLVGGTGGNTFEFISPGAVTGTITGGGGTETIIGDNNGDTFSITGTNAGSIASILPGGFTNIANLTGGAGTDRFAFLAGGSLTGSLNGGTGSNTLDDSQYGSAVTVNVAQGTATGVGGTFKAIAAFAGTGTTDTLSGTNANSVWLITGPNAGTVGYYTFTAFPNLVGGTGGNIFELKLSATVASVTGGASGTNELDYSAVGSPVTVNLQTSTTTGLGTWANIQTQRGTDTTDTLIGMDGTTNTWTLSGANAGTVNGVSFLGFANLTGGSGADDFVFSAGARLSGVVDGMGGSNTLDYSAYNAPVRVNLGHGTSGMASSSATGVDALNANGIANIGTVIAGSGNNVLSAFGATTAVTFTAGGNGNNILLGGSGQNTLTVTGTGNNVIIGEKGASVLSGGTGYNLLIGGNTAYDAVLSDLQSILSIWETVNSAGTYSAAISALMAKSYAYSLTSTTVHGTKNDAIAAGTHNLDWYFAALASEITGATSGEVDTLC